MTEVLQSPSQLPSPSSCSSNSPCGGSHQTALINSPNNTVEIEGVVLQSQLDLAEEEEEGECEKTEKDRERDQLSILTLLIETFRKSLIGCSASSSAGDLSSSSMEIGWPSNVRHVAHVTFDRFHGFLGLPVEFEPEVPRRPPSASANVFGVSTESMQLSFDARGNSVPTILLLMQRHLYAQGGLQAEGIFRINAENGQEESVREQLNRGVVPEGIDVHCLAGLIKAWFRELPTGVLDPLLPEQVMQSQSEEECSQLVRLLPPTEAALLDWAINLMADVAQLEHLNKMNARNVAMVFAPNMTHMADPLTALMYAVQVMNFLKTLVVKTLRDREESMVNSNPVSNLNSFDDDGHHSTSQLILKDDSESEKDCNEEFKEFVTEEPSQQSPSHGTEDSCETESGSKILDSCETESGSKILDSCETESGSKILTTSTENFISRENRLLVDTCPCNLVSQLCSMAIGLQDSNNLASAECKEDQSNICKSKSLQLNTSKLIDLPAAGSTEKNLGTSIIGRINSRTELAEAWR